MDNGSFYWFSEGDGLMIARRDRGQWYGAVSGQNVWSSIDYDDTVRYRVGLAMVINGISDNMLKALRQVAAGVFPTIDGYYDDSGRRLDLRSTYALMRRGLVVASGVTTVSGVFLSNGELDLTPAGWNAYRYYQRLDCSTGS